MDELKELNEIEEAEDSMVMFWERELDRIGNTLFEEDDPETCNRLWQQLYLAESYLLNHISARLRVWGAINSAERLGVK